MPSGTPRVPIHWSDCLKALEEEVAALRKPNPFFPMSGVRTIQEIAERMRDILRDAGMKG